jgi:bifunctional non-homologous end joining protein LigD
VSFRDGKPSFAQLQYRLGFNNSLAPAARAAKVGVSFQAFDLLYLDDRTLLREPLELRKELLSQHFSSGDFAQPCEFIYDHGCAFMEAVEEQGLEGMVAKELTSRYLPGKRSSAWQKIKVLRSAEFVIGGYTFGAGYREQSFGALLLGAYRRDGTLQFVGQVGGGFSDPLLEQIGALLADRHVADSPFVDPPQIDRFSFWCRPDLVCKVRYAELTDQGRLRFPIFESLRDDVDPRDCTVESLGPSPANPPLPLGVDP